MDYFKQFLKNILEFVRALSPSQAIVLIGIVAGIIVGAVVVTRWVSQVNYASLYSNLESGEAGEIVGYLTEQNVPYRLTDGGTTISVPSGEVYRLRISLASQGMPQSGNIGYAVFDQSNLGMTEFLQNLNFRRALEGELMRTIMQLADVQAARVHIVMPRERLFKENQEEATASVVLKLKRAGNLSENQLAGITHLVASSVEGLQPENISIIDYNGNLLSSKTESDKLAGLTASQLEVRRDVENYLQDKAQSMLDGLVGHGNAIVRVTAELDFQQLERTSEVYDPNSAVIRSEEINNENRMSSDKQEELAESTDENSLESSVTNYEINKTVEHFVNSVGNIQRLSAAVLLDGIYREETGAGGVAETVYEPRPQENIDRITSAVKSAIGFDSERDDQVEVINLAFDRESMQFEQDQLNQLYQMQFLYDIGKKIGLVLLGILLFLYLRKKLKRFFASLSGLAPRPKYYARGGETGGGEVDESGGEVPHVEPEKRQPRLIDEMQKTAKNSPEEIAKVIRTMMVE